MNTIIQLPLYINKNNFNIKNVNIIKETINYKLNLYGVIYGELLDKIHIDKHFDISSTMVSHILKSINLYKRTAIIEILNTRKGELLEEMITNLNMYAIVRDYQNNNNYKFFTIDIIDYVPKNYIPLSCLRKEKIKRLLK